jgi:hypothetical protein
MILNPELYKQAKEIADKTYKTHGAYKSAFLVKKYKELGGEYASDGKPRNLTRWFKEEWKDVAGMPYPVYRPTKRVSDETPLTVNEISPESLTRNAIVKQIYKNKRNLEPFEMIGGVIDHTYPNLQQIKDLYAQVRAILIDLPITANKQGVWNQARELVIQFEQQWNIPPGSARWEHFYDEAMYSDAFVVIRELVWEGVHLIYQHRPDYVLPKDLKTFAVELQEMINGDYQGSGRLTGSGFYKFPDGCTLYTGGSLTSKRIAEFSQSVQGIFNMLSVSRKYKIIGSGGLKEIKYSADYDLNEIFKDEISDKSSTLDRLYKVFKEKFITAKEDPNVWITDFKCGEDSDGEPLRWSYQDMMRGTKRMADGRIVRFQECLLMKSTLKLDMIAFIEGRFLDFSDNYFLKIGNDSNFFPHDIETGHLLNSIKHDYSFQMFSASNYFKALKRAFSYYKLEGEGKNETKVNRLLAFFNSETGLLYKLTSEIKTIQIILEQDFRKPVLDQVRQNIQLIIEQLPGRANVRSILDHAIEQRTPKSISQYLEKANEILNKDINDSTLSFVSKNKNLLLV